MLLRARAEPGTGKPIEQGRVYISKDKPSSEAKGQYFEGVPPEVWNFHIGGYQVCEKWLKDHRRRVLTYDDLTHYAKVVTALKETIRLIRKLTRLSPNGRLNEGKKGTSMTEEQTYNLGEPENNNDDELGSEVPPYPPLLDYLQSKEGHELASRIVAILEDVKKARIESATETHKRNLEIQKVWLYLQSGVFALTILIAAVLAWQ